MCIQEMNRRERERERGREEEREKKKREKKKIKPIEKISRFEKTWNGKRMLQA